MAKLTAKRRNAVPKKAIPKPYSISPAEKARVVAKANRMLAGKG